MVEDFTNFPAVTQILGDRALYQMVRANLELTNLDGANSAMDRLLKLYPASDLANNSILLVGEGLADARQPAAARAIFRKFRRVLPEFTAAAGRSWPSRAPMSRTRTDWPAAIQPIRKLAEGLSHQPPAVPGGLCAGLGIFSGGKRNECVRCCSPILSRSFPPMISPRWPNGGWPTIISVWAGRITWTRNEITKLLYQNTNWQGSPLIIQARLMAGRAAMGLPSYKDAIDHFTSLTSDTNCPPDLDVQALFALRQRADAAGFAGHQQAAGEFSTGHERVQPDLPVVSDQRTRLAGLVEIGDCALQLTNYDAATNAYAQVFDSPLADISARSQAQIGFGTRAGKKGGPGGRHHQTGCSSWPWIIISTCFNGLKNLRDGEPADPFWVKKAGLQALPLVEALGRGRSGRNFSTTWKGCFPS